MGTCFFNVLLDFRNIFPFFLLNYILVPELAKGMGKYFIRPFLMLN